MTSILPAQSGAQLPVNLDSCLDSSLESSLDQSTEGKTEGLTEAKIEARIEDNLETMIPTLISAIVDPDLDPDLDKSLDKNFDKLDKVKRIQLGLSNGLRLMNGTKNVTQGKARSIRNYVKGKFIRRRDCPSRHFWIESWVAEQSKLLEADVLSDVRATEIEYNAQDHASPSLREALEGIEGAQNSHEMGSDGMHADSEADEPGNVPFVIDQQDESGGGFNESDHESGDDEGNDDSIQTGAVRSLDRGSLLQLIAQCLEKYHQYSEVLVGKRNIYSKYRYEVMKRYYGNRTSGKDVLEAANEAADNASVSDCSSTPDEFPEPSTDESWDFEKDTFSSFMVCFTAKSSSRVPDNLSEEVAAGSINYHGYIFLSDTDRNGCYEDERLRNLVECQSLEQPNIQQLCSEFQLVFPGTDLQIDFDLITADLDTTFCATSVEKTCTLLRRLRVVTFVKRGTQLMRFFKKVPKLVPQYGAVRFLQDFTKQYFDTLAYIHSNGRLLCNFKPGTFRILLVDNSKGVGSERLLAEQIKPKIKVIFGDLRNCSFSKGLTKYLSKEHWIFRTALNDKNIRVAIDNAESKYKRRRTTAGGLADNQGVDQVDDGFTYYNLSKEKVHAACLLRYVRNSQDYLVPITGTSVHLDSISKSVREIAGHFIASEGTTSAKTTEETVVETTRMYRWALFRDMWVNRDYFNRMENLLHNIINQRLSLNLIHFHCFFFSSRETLAMISDFSESLLSAGISSSDSKELSKSDELDEATKNKYEMLHRKCQNAKRNVQVNAFGNHNFSWHKAIMSAGLDENELKKTRCTSSPLLWAYLESEKDGYGVYVQECVSRSGMSSEPKAEGLETASNSSKQGSIKESEPAVQTTEPSRIYSKSREYKDYTSDLLRLIRNLNMHYTELHSTLQAEIGRKPKDLLRFFSFRFPGLPTAVFIEALREDFWDGVPNKLGRLPAVSPCSIMDNAEYINYRELFEAPFDPRTEEE